MQFTLKTFLVLFVVLATSLAAFGPLGFLVTLILATGVWFQVRRGWAVALAVVAALGTLFLALLPSVARVSECSRRGECKNNLKQIGVALRMYHDAHGRFPPAFVADANGKGFHSWRTLLLPFLEEQALLRGDDLTVPWNDTPSEMSPAEALGFLKCPSSPWSRTHYLAVIGPGTAWPAEQGSQLSDFTDKLSETVLVVEVSDTEAHWMEPRDLTVAEALGPSDGQTTVPRSHHYEKATYFLRERPVAGHVLFADGSVRCLPEHLSRDELMALLTIGGGEEVDVEDLFAPRTGYWIEALRWDHCLGLPLFLFSLFWFWRRMVADARMGRI